MFSLSLIPPLPPSISHNGALLGFLSCQEESSFSQLAKTHSWAEEEPPLWACPCLLLLFLPLSGPSSQQSPSQFSSERTHFHLLSSMPTVLVCYFLPLEQKVASHVFSSLCLSSYLWKVVPIKYSFFNISWVTTFVSDLLWLVYLCSLSFPCLQSPFLISLSLTPYFYFHLKPSFSIWFLITLISTACAPSFSFLTTLSSNVDFITLCILSVHNIVAVSFSFFSWNVVWCKTNVMPWRFPFVTNTAYIILSIKLYLCLFSCC